MADGLEPSGRVGLVWFCPVPHSFIGEIPEPNDKLRVSFLDPDCGDTYDDKMSYARIVADNCGVRISVLCPLLKLVRLDEAGEGEGDDAADWNMCGLAGFCGDLIPSVGGNLIASGLVSSDPIYTVKARGAGETKWLRSCVE